MKAWNGSRQGMKMKGNEIDLRGKANQGNVPPPPQYMGPQMVFYQPAVRRNLPQPTICPLCGGTLFDKPYRFNDPRSGLPPAWAYRCRSCEYFITMQISVNPQDMNKVLKESEKFDKKFHQDPAYRPKRLDEGIQ